MKKSSLTTAVVAGIAGAAGLANVATAMNINPDGLGQVLLYPYYTVNNGLVTVFSVVNTTDEVKAVKVRFLEGHNSKEVLDFNLYLSPFDVWTGALTDAGNPDGPGVLYSQDTSCIAPVQIPASGQPFVNYQYVGANDDGGIDSLSRTREGHIEMIEMGVVGDAQGSAPFNLATAATHNPFSAASAAAGRPVPNDCGDIRAAWQAGGVWRVAPRADDDVAPPEGGLFGAASVVNVAAGIAYSYNPDAIEGFFARPDLVDSPIHTFPGTVGPDLGDASDLIADLTGNTSTAVIFDNGALVTMAFDTARFRAVSALFMHNEIYNEYNTTASMGASSEWVITFPTKRKHLENTGVIRLPFISSFGVGGACEPIDINFWDREEDTPGTIPDEVPFSPPPPVTTAPGLNLCYEAQVVSFNQGGGASEILGSNPSIARNINLCRVFGAAGDCADANGDSVLDEADEFHEGWLRMQLGNDGIDFADPLFSPALLTHFLVDDDVDGDGFHNLAAGLPATGFWVANYINGDAGTGTLRNYSQIHKHRADRDGYTVDGLDGGGAPIPVLDLDGNPLAWS